MNTCPPSEGDSNWSLFKHWVINSVGFQINILFTISPVLLLTPLPGPPPRTMSVSSPCIVTTIAAWNSLNCLRRIIFVDRNFNHKLTRPWTYKTLLSISVVLKLMTLLQRMVVLPTLGASPPGNARGPSFFHEGVFLPATARNKGVADKREGVTLSATSKWRRTFIRKRRNYTVPHFGEDFNVFSSAIVISCASTDYQTCKWKPLHLCSYI